jgi:hypothetical protein
MACFGADRGGMSTPDRPPDRYQELFGVSAAELRRRGVDPDDYAFQREREANKASSRVFSDYHLPPTPNWRLRGFLALLAVVVVGWLLNVIQIFHTVNSAGNLVALAILTPPAGFADQPDCDVPETKACFQSATANARLESASAAALVRSFGVSPDTPTCPGSGAEMCSGRATILVPGPATTMTTVNFRYTITVGYLTTGPPLTVGTRVEFTVVNGR